MWLHTTAQETPLIIFLRLNREFVKPRQIFCLHPCLLHIAAAIIRSAHTFSIATLYHLEPSLATFASISFSCYSQYAPKRYHIVAIQFITGYNMHELQRNYTRPAVDASRNTGTEPQTVCRYSYIVCLLLRLIRCKVFT